MIELHESRGGGVIMTLNRMDLSRIKKAVTRQLNWLKRVQEEHDLTEMQRRIKFWQALEEELDTIKLD